MTVDARFPDAPPGSWVSEEGWLIVRDQAWTEDEWNAKPATRPRSSTNGRPPIHRSPMARRHAEYDRQQARALGISIEERQRRCRRCQRQQRGAA